MSEPTGPQGRRPATRTMVRTAVPIVVAGIAISSLSVVPALAGDAAPTLPKISAADLIAKVQKSNVQQLHGTVTVSTDLGLPTLPDVGGASPLGVLAGDHTLRVAVDGPDKQRIALLGPASEQDLVHNGDNAWSYDSARRAAEHWTLPAGHDAASKPSGPALDPRHLPSTPQEMADQMLAQVQKYTVVDVDGTAKVAGRPVYTLVLKPKQDGSLIREVDFGVDSATGVPLRAAVYPAKSGHAAVDARFTDVSFSAPDAGTFDFTPPAGAKVTEHKPGDAADRPKTPGAPRDNGHGAILGEGWTSVVELTGVPNLDALSSGHAAVPKPGARPQKAEGRGSSAALLDKLLATGKPVSGGFGSGKLFTTTLVSALYTDDGRLFVGAVTPEELTKQAANAKPAAAGGAKPGGSA